MRRKHVIRLLLVVVLIVSIAHVALAGVYWGSVKSDKYHYPECRWAKKIHAVNLVVFESVVEAKKAGYVACKVCKPSR